MATDQQSSAVEQIGEIAGQIWHLLDQQGSLSTAQLITQADAPRDVVLQAIGWLAREDKISIDETRAKNLSLR